MGLILCVEKRSVRVLLVVAVGTKLVSTLKFNLMTYLFRAGLCSSSSPTSQRRHATSNLTYLYLRKQQVYIVLYKCLAANNRAVLGLYRPESSQRRLRRHHDPSAHTAQIRVNFSLCAHTVRVGLAPRALSRRTLHIELACVVTIRPAVMDPTRIGSLALISDATVLRSSVLIL